MANNIHALPDADVAGVTPRQSLSALQGGEGCGLNSTAIDEDSRHDAIKTTRCAFLIVVFYCLTMISGALLPSHENLDITERSVGPRIASVILRNLLLNDITRSGHASKKFTAHIERYYSKRV